MNYINNCKIGFYIQLFKLTKFYLAIENVFLSAKSETLQKRLSKHTELFIYIIYFRLLYINKL